ncbi:hypothetical protein FISHEDRAFT_55416 [Fistulina hepatica ATCC 64428]|uniref:Transmembrane protein n=1 Tax=Fistulina hepatica ATCC 64428 TaxID=1128425 RepID=A0A0D7AMT2_9AGAR|nr:hypothetical protein FISHEDRAFT_55416 [Fistulina hepatica ATCC 64428]
MKYLGFWVLVAFFLHIVCAHPAFSSKAAKRSLDDLCQLRQRVEACSSSENRRAAIILSEDDDDSSDPTPSHCTCTMVFFNIWSACRMASAGSVPQYDDWSSECETDSFEFTRDTSYGSIDIPTWAYVSVTNNTFNLAAALQETTSSASSWSLVQIIVSAFLGGGFVLMVLVLFRGYYKGQGYASLFKRNRRVRRGRPSTEWSIDDNDQVKDQEQVPDYRSDDESDFSLPASNGHGHFRSSSGVPLNALGADKSQRRSHPRSESLEGNKFTHVMKVFRNKMRSRPARPVLELDRDSKFKIDISTGIPSQRADSLLPTKLSSSISNAPEPPETIRADLGDEYMDDSRGTVLQDDESRMPTQMKHNRSPFYFLAVQHSSEGTPYEAVSQSEQLEQDVIDICPQADHEGPREEDDMERVEMHHSDQPTVPIQLIRSPRRILDLPPLPTSPPPVPPENERAFIRSPTPESMIPHQTPPPSPAVPRIPLPGQSKGPALYLDDSVVSHQNSVLSTDMLSTPPPSIKRDVSFQSASSQLARGPRPVPSKHSVSRSADISYESSIVATDAPTHYDAPQLLTLDVPPPAHPSISRSIGNAPLRVLHRSSRSQGSTSAEGWVSDAGLASRRFASSP